MANDRRKVYHVTQGVVECYEHTRQGWKHIPQSIADDWNGKTFDYYELRHNQDRDSRGLYGSHVKNY